MGLFKLIFLKKKNQARRFEYNSALFDQFYRDLENNALPEVPDPTKEEIEYYTQKRSERLADNDPYADSLTKSLLQENNSIPVDVEIWVDKVFSHYFDNLIPMLGLVHWCDGAQKALYKYKGYTWYTSSELYPTICFD